MSVNLLISGLLSHGFREIEPIAGWRIFRRLGRGDRFLREDGKIVIKDSLHPQDDLDCGVDSDYHALLRKCGSIWERTRARQAENALLVKMPKLRQHSLPLNADEMLGEIGGSDGTVR